MTAVEQVGLTGGTVNAFCRIDQQLVFGNSRIVPSVQVNAVYRTDFHTGSVHQRTKETHQVIARLATLRHFGDDPAHLFSRKGSQRLGPDITQ
jgi:hypothetical protein